MNKLTKLLTIEDNCMKKNAKELWHIIQSKWTLLIPILALILAAIELIIKSEHLLCLNLAISIFSSWLVFFLADYLPETINKKRAMAIIKPKLREIYRQIECLDSILCVVTQSNKEDSTENKLEKIKHIATINTSYNVLRTITNSEGAEIRVRDTMSCEDVRNLENKIEKALHEIEKFWSYLPLSLCNTLALLDENNGFYDILSRPTISTQLHLTGICQGLDNRVLVDKYKSFMDCKDLLGELDGVKCKYNMEMDSKHMG